MAEGCNELRERCVEVERAVEAVDQFRDFRGNREAQLGDGVDDERTGLAKGEKVDEFGSAERHARCGAINSVLGSTGDAREMAGDEPAIIGGLEFRHGRRADLARMGTPGPEPTATGRSTRRGGLARKYDARS